MKTPRMYAMDARFLSRLLADREDLFAAARDLRTAEAMRVAKEDVLKGASLNVTPSADVDLSQLYSVDAEGTAHIPIVGELTPKAREDVCGAYTAERLTEYGYIQMAALAADADPRVEAIAFEMDSPGGYLDGLDQTAQVIAALSKPTRTNVTNMAASAAYWLASQTDHIGASSPADEIGSIGVAVEWWDGTKAMENEGYKRMTFTSTEAPNKRPDYATDEGKAQLIASLNATHAIFARRVARGRHVSIDKVNSDFGRGGMLLAEAAMKAGMIDAVQGVILDRPSQEKPAGVAGAAPVKAEASHSQGVPMTIEELKKEHPDLYAAIFGTGKEAGVAEERMRIMALQRWAEADADNAKVLAIVKEAQATGKTEAEVLPQLQVAVRGAAKSQGDNPPAVTTAAPVSGAGFDAEGLRMIAAAGLSPELVAKDGRK